MIDGWTAEQMTTMRERNKEVQMAVNDATTVKEVKEIEDLRNIVKEQVNQIDNLYRRIGYLEGMVEGLSYSIRCNGVSGAEVGRDE